MADLKLVSGTGGFWWQIINLQSNFTSESYIRVGIANEPVAFGADSIRGIEAYNDTFTGTTSSQSVKKIYGPGTFTFYGFAQVASDGLYYPAGSATVYVADTDPDPPAIDVSFSITDTTSDSITVRVYVDSDAPYYKILCRDDDSYEETIPYSGFDYHTSNYSETFTGLEPSTRYYINVQYSTTGGSNTGTWVGRDETWTEDQETPSIEKWSWSQSNGDASASQTINAYNAITNRGLLSDFSYKVWNDMVQKVNDILYEFGYAWDSTYLTYGLTKMSESDTEMTSNRFNSLRHNIGIHYSTDLTVEDLDPGKPIMGWYFTRLTVRMNSWIDRGY